jgi:uncharacterized protein (TIGR01777 family)
MRILLAGASGFLGSKLIPHLRERGHDLVQLVRRPPANASEVRWDPAKGELDGTLVSTVDTVLNLAGAGVGDKRWTDEYKKVLLSSRVDTTRTLAQALARTGGKKVFLAGSAVGFYGNRGDARIDETAERGQGFLADLVVAWEGATEAAEQAGHRVAHLRTGIPLDPGGGMLKPLYWQFKLFAGGPMGSGKQYVPWISVPDWLSAIDFVLDHDDIAGPVNLVGPDPVTNAELSRNLARLMHRPNLLPVPVFALKAVAGEFAGEAVTSQRIFPGVLEAKGFQFAHPTVSDALRWALADAAGKHA